MSTVLEIASLCSGIMDDKGFYVYYLCDDKEVIYVGKSKRLMTRLHHHVLGARSKPFRYFLYRQVPSKWAMERLEAEEIQRLRPRLNKVIPEIPQTEHEHRAGQQRIAKAMSDACAAYLPEISHAG